MSSAAAGSWEASCQWKTVVRSPEGDDPAGSDEANYQTLVPAHLLTGIDSEECKTLVPLPVALEFSSDLSHLREHAAGESPAEPVQDFPGVVQEEVTFGQPVWLHVYDLTDSFQLPVLNSALRQAGAGLFHAGIEVHGYEYSFGLRQRGSGVYTSVPKNNTAHAYRESFLLGNTLVDRKELKKIIKELKKEWPGRSYGPLTRNCIHFSATLSERLGVGAVPCWVYGFAESLRSFVNRLADCSESVARIADETNCAGMVQILDAHEEVHALDLKHGSGSTMRL